MTAPAAITPYNVDAERALLGTLIEAPQLAESCGVRPGDLAPGPGHPELLSAILAVYEAKGSADPILLVEELRRRDQLARVGEGGESGAHRGPLYLSDLVAAARTPGTLGHFALLVREATVRRRLHEVGSRLVQTATSTADLDAVLDVAAELVLHLGVVVDEPVDGDAPIPGLSLVADFVREPSPPHAWVIPGVVERADRVMLIAGEGVGKALDLDTPVLTTRGWSTMGALTVGDRVFHPDGTPTEVIAATDVMHDRPCYRVRFSDGAEMIADADHQWATSDYRQRQPRHQGPRSSVRTTRELARTLTARGGHTLNHSVHVAAPLQFPTEQSLPVPPYTLGAWLGDGSSWHATLTCADEEIVEQVESDGYTVRKLSGQPYAWAITAKEDRQRRERDALVLVAAGATVAQAERQVGLPRGGMLARGLAPRCAGTRNTRPAPLSGDLPTYDRPWQPLRPALRNLGVLPTKHIPDIYLRAPLADRLALLQGIMDTDGTVSANGLQCEITLTNERLARDVHELITGLGHKATIRESDAKLNGRVVGRRWRITFQATLDVFRLPRKRTRRRPLPTQRSLRRYIVTVDPVPSRPVRCIQVDRSDGLYLAGRELITTHNSVLARQVCTLLAAGRHPFMPKAAIRPRRTLLVDLENPPDLVRRGLRGIVGQVWDEGVDVDDRMWRWNRPGGIDLRSPGDRALLARVIERTRPDLVAIGPIYKAWLSRPGDTHESAAADVAAAIDHLRERYGCAFWIEHHAPKADSSGRRSDPVGSSLWLRWPEFGLALKPEPHNDDRNVYILERFRGDRDVRCWPDRLLKGVSRWPWTADYDPDNKADLFDAIEEDATGIAHRRTEGAHQ